MIANTMTATTKTNDNVLSFTEPKVKFSGTKWMNVKDVGKGFIKKNHFFNSQQETLQIKSLEDIIGEELKGLRKFVSNVPIDNRFFNPNPKDWMDVTSNETSFNSVHNWWLDMMYVLSQTTPEIAKNFFVPIDVVSNGDENLKKELKKLCSGRITKINKKKIAKFHANTLAPELAIKLQGQVIFNHFWETIGEHLGNQYVTNHFIDIYNLEPLLIAHAMSETVIPLFGELMMGEGWLEKNWGLNDENDELYKEVGDLATLFGILTIFRLTNSDEEYENLMSSKSMTSYFSSEGLKTLDKILVTTPKGGVPVFSVKDEFTTD